MKRNFLIIAAVLLVLGLCIGKPIGLYFHFLPYFLEGPAPSYQCGEGPGFRYCVFDPPSATLEDPDTVLYFLHYGSGDEKSWKLLPISRVFYAEFRKKGLKAPRVVSVSYGPYWSLFDKGGGRLASPVASDFLDRAMPWLENKTGLPKRRYIWGMSQGGLNAALILFKRPELWSGTVMSCPALFDFDIYASKDKVVTYANEHGLKPNRLQYGMDLVLNRIASPKEWKREDPLVRAAGKLPSSLAPIFIECNRGDEFGFCGGAREFAKILTSRGQKIEFEEEPGDHCATDPWGPSRFIANLEELRS